MKVSKYIFKAVTPVMALFQKQLRLPFKQGYDNLRSTCGESAASADSARSEKHFHRNQSAVCSSHNVPSDIKYNDTITMPESHFIHFSPVACPTNSHHKQHIGV